MDLVENCRVCDPNIGDYNVYIEDCRSFEELLQESKENVIKPPNTGFHELNRRSIIKWVIEKATNTTRSQSDIDSIFIDCDIYKNDIVLTILEEMGVYLRFDDDEDQETVLHIAARMGISEVITWLVENGADMEARFQGYKPIHLAARHGHLKAVIRLANLGADTESYVYDHGSVLNVAAAYGHNDIIKWLVYGNEFDINVKTWNGRTALHNALIFNQFETMQWLGNNKAINVNDMDTTGQTAVHIAAKSGKVEVLKWLVQHGAELFIKNDTRETVFHISAELGHSNMAKWLLQMGAQINAKKMNGFTPLHLSALNGHLNMVKFLVHYGADLTVRERTGKSVLHVAAENGNLDIVKFLYKHGCDIDAVDNYNNSVFQSSLNFVDVNNWLIEVKIQLEIARERDLEIMQEYEIARQLEVDQEVEMIRELERTIEMETEREIMKRKQEEAARREKKKKRKRESGIHKRAADMIKTDLNAKRFHLKMTLRVKK